MPKRKVADLVAEAQAASGHILRSKRSTTNQGSLVRLEEEQSSNDDQSTTVQLVTQAHVGSSDEDDVDMDALLDAATDALATRTPVAKAAPLEAAKPLLKVKDGVVKLDPGVFHAETEKLSAVQAAQKAKEKGIDWFELKTPEITDSLKRDLQILRMRSVLDPKRHYRKENTRTVGADAKKLAGPRFEVGTLLADATESAAHKTRRKDQKQTIVEELLADTDRRAYLKRKQAEIDQQKRSGGKGFYKKVKDRRGSRFSKSAK